jgi:amino acid permease
MVEKGNAQQGVYIYIYIYVCMYVCMYVYVYMYDYMYSERENAFIEQ